MQPFELKLYISEMYRDQVNENRNDLSTSEMPCNSRAYIHVQTTVVVGSSLRLCKSAISIPETGLKTEELCAYRLAVSLELCFIQ